MSGGSVGRPPSLLRELFPSSTTPEPDRRLPLPVKLALAQLRALRLCSSMARIGGITHMNYCHPSYRSGWSFWPVGHGQFPTAREWHTLGRGLLPPGHHVFSANQHLAL